MGSKKKYLGHSGRFGNLVASFIIILKIVELFTRCGKSEKISKLVELVISCKKSEKIFWTLRQI